MMKMNRKGITLIELVIVMAIIAIGAVLVMPNIGAWIPTYRLKGVTRDIISTMRVAQMKAISSNKTYQVTFDPVGNNYILQYQGSGGLVNDGVAQTLPSGVQFVTTFGGNTASFYSDSSATGGTITVTNTKGSQKTITLWGTTGRIKHG
jgi:prepilin-type N-terminal cleavage/methylation domain-containing protein